MKTQVLLHPGNALAPTFLKDTHAVLQCLVRFRHSSILDHLNASDQPMPVADFASRAASVQHSGISLLEYVPRIPRCPITLRHCSIHSVLPTNLCLWLTLLAELTTTLSQELAKPAPAASAILS